MKIGTIDSGKINARIWGKVATGGSKVSAFYRGQPSTIQDYLEKSEYMFIFIHIDTLNFQYS